MDDAQERLAQSWDEAAEGYDQYFVPRFAPWLNDAVQAVAGVELPPGPVLVPCCGTFPELPALQAALPGRELVGVDLSAGMIDLARERAAGSPDVELIVGDAADLDPRWTSACAAVVSVFGLQQLPEPAAGLASWVGALAPGGVLSVMFWLPVPEADGPFALLRQVIDPKPADEPAWPGLLADDVRSAGGVLERDADVVHPMSHPDAAAVFDATMDTGSCRGFAREQPAEVMQSLRAKFVAASPTGEWTHHPRARHIVARRPAG